MTFKNKISTVVAVLAIPAMAGFLATCKPKSEPIQTNLVRDRGYVEATAVIKPDGHLLNNSVQYGIFGLVPKGENKLDNRYMMLFRIDSIGERATSKPDSSTFTPYVSVFRHILAQSAAKTNEDSINILPTDKLLFQGPIVKGTLTSFSGQIPSDVIDDRYRLLLHAENHRDILIPNHGNPGVIQQIEANFEVIYELPDTAKRVN